MAEERSVWEKLVHESIEAVKAKEEEELKKEEEAKKAASNTSANTGSSKSANLPAITSDVAQVYEVLAPMAGDYMNAQAEQIGQAQRSMGTLASQAMGQSQTSGLGNYTYNRLMRPQVDTMRDELRVQGYAAQLNRLLNDTLNKARNNYNRNSGGGSGGGGGNNGGDNDKKWDGEIEEENEQEDALYLTGSEAWALTHDSGRLLTKEELEEATGRPMTDSEYAWYKNRYNRREAHK